MRPPEEVAAMAAALRTVAPAAGRFVLISTDEAADLIGMRPGELAKWRCENSGPAYIRGRPVLYDLADVLDFIERRRAWLQAMTPEPPSELPIQ
jgi:hypothetical protein